MVCVAGTLDPRPAGRMKLELEAMFVLKANPGPGMCVVRGCREKHVPERKAGKLYLCGGHFQARWRAMNPKQAAYDTLRTHARQRRIGFALTFTRFVEITDAAGFWNRRPEDPTLSIDRIRAAEDYSDDNVQVLTLTDNVVKGNKERWLPEHVQAILARKREQAWQVSGAREDSWLD